MSSFIFNDVPHKQRIWSIAVGVRIFRKNSLKLIPFQPSFGAKFCQRANYSELRMPPV